MRNMIIEVSVVKEIIDDLYQEKDRPLYSK